MMAQQWNQRPSQIINLQPNSYEAFCFDEACTFILNEIKNEKRPKFKQDEKGKPTDNSDLINFFNENNNKL